MRDDQSIAQQINKLVYCIPIMIMNDNILINLINFPLMIMKDKICCTMMSQLLSKSINWYIVDQSIKVHSYCAAIALRC